MNEDIETVRRRGTYSSRLEEAVAFFPTPTVQDAIHPGRSKIKPGQQVSLAAAALHDKSSAEIKANGSETSEVSGQLNPTWVEWLMGFPPDWTDLRDSETPSSPKSPSSSDGG